MLGERLTKLLLEEGFKIGQVHIARAQARYGRFVGVHQARLLEQALQFLARGGTALVRAVLHPNCAVLVHVGLVDTFSDR